MESSRFWRPDATMAPQWGPVNFGPEPKTPQIRNKIKILSFILCLTTVTIYRTKPSSEMTAHQGPSNTYNTTPNALPRDIRVRGSKPANQHYRNPSMEHRSAKTHTQSSNTEKHHTHPRNNEDTITQQTPGTKNYYSPKLLSERNRNKHTICLTHKYLQDIYQPYRRNQQNGSNTWESQKFPTNSYSRRTCQKNHTKTINKAQTNQTSTRNSNPASIWGLLRPSVSPSKPPFLYLPRPITNNRRHP